MNLILNELGGLALGSVPTIVLFLLTIAAYSLLVQRPLSKILAERRALTSGAVEQAKGAISAAEEKMAVYEEKLRAAKAEIRASREEKPLWSRRAAGRRSASRHRARRSSRAPRPLGSRSRVPARR